MNEEELKKYLKDNFTNYIRESIDSSIIFKYISEIEIESKKLNKIVKEFDDYLDSKLFENEGKDNIEFLNIYNKWQDINKDIDI